MTTFDTAELLVQACREELARPVLADALEEGDFVALNLHGDTSPGITRIALRRLRERRLGPYMLQKVGQFVLPGPRKVLVVGDSEPNVGRADTHLVTLAPWGVCRACRPGHAFRGTEGVGLRGDTHGFETPLAWVSEGWYASQVRETLEMEGEASRPEEVRELVEERLAGPWDFPGLIAHYPEVALSFARCPSER